MNLSFINKIKYSSILYNCYYHIGSLALRIFSSFIKPIPNRVFFISFGGRKYDDSPRVIYEKMINDSRFKDMEIIWGFQNPENHHIRLGSKVKVDTISYYIHLLKSSVWITNSGVERGLSLSKGKRLYINTWHGTPIKKMGSDIDKSNTSFGSKGSGNVPDYFMAQGNYDAEIFSRVFNIPRKNIAVIGLPRNDELVEGNNKINICKLKKSLNIPDGKKIILYAPTFREYEKDGNKNCILRPPLNFDRWQKVLGNDYVFLLRAHYEVVKLLDVKENTFVMDVSKYPHLNDLMLISDVLISDYSSIFFDYSILGRPMIPYCYDYDIYSTKRGMYFDIRESLPCNITKEEDLLSVIKSGIYQQYMEYAVNFRDKYIQSFGNATKMTLDIITSHIS